MAVGIAGIERTTEKTHIWLNEIADELGVEERDYAYRALSVVLHVLRDRLPIDVAAKLASQLPTLVRGIYYDQWNPDYAPHEVKTVDDFLERVMHEAHIGTDMEAAIAVRAVIRVLRRHISTGEMYDVVTVLPDRIKILIEA